MDLIIVGCQAGDEGKGRFTDVFAKDAHAVVRFQGGPHTGHTVVTGGQVFRFVQLPAGILRGAIGVLGNGCVIDPAKLLNELRTLEKRIGSVRLGISKTAHVVMPYHPIQDELMENWRGQLVATSADTGLLAGIGQIGSTKLGVGPCREDKIARIGIRMIDLLDRDLLHERLNRVVAFKRQLFERVLGASAGVFDTALDIDRMVQQYHSFGRQLEPYLCDVSSLLVSARQRNQLIVYEGAQSMGLDLDFGTYPYCSSGQSAACGVTVGTGTSPRVDFHILGVAKAYMVRVGGGPLPTELRGKPADYLIDKGHEFGTVTGRRRRVGWFDLAFVRKAVRVDGVERLCVSGIDVLAGLPEVFVAVHYIVNDEQTDEYPVDLAAAARVQPVLKSFTGWPQRDWTEIARRGVSALPTATRKYLDFLAESLETPLAAIGVGPGREQTIMVE